MSTQVIIRLDEQLSQARRPRFFAKTVEVLKNCREFQRRVGAKAGEFKQVVRTRALWLRYASRCPVEPTVKKVTIP